MAARKTAATAAAAPSTGPVATARVFWSGRSQAVRLPKEFRVTAAVLEIHREGDRIVLEPPKVEVDALGWPKGFWDNPPHVDDTFDLGDRNQPHERPDPLGTGPIRRRKSRP